MTRLALYDDDREYAERKETELLAIRENGGYYFELGPRGAITYCEWTCEWCETTIRDAGANTKVAFHRIGCDKTPHPDQSELPVSEVHPT